MSLTVWGVDSDYSELHVCVSLSVWGVDSDYNEEDEKERRQLIEQVFELQNTLDGQYLLTYSL